MTYSMPDKDSSANLDYKIDFKPRSNGSSNPGVTDWLQSGETIVSASVIVTALTSGCLPVITGSSLVSGSSAVLVWLCGGDNFKEYNVTTSIVTSEGRIDQKTFKLKIMDQ